MFPAWRCSRSVRRSARRWGKQSCPPAPAAGHRAARFSAAWACGRRAEIADNGSRDGGDIGRFMPRQGDARASSSSQMLGVLPSTSESRAVKVEKSACPSSIPFASDWLAACAAKQQRSRNWAEKAPWGGAARPYAVGEKLLVRFLSQDFPALGLKLARKRRPAWQARSGIPWLPRR